MGFWVWSTGLFHQFVPSIPTSAFAVFKNSCGFGLLFLFLKCLRVLETHYLLIIRGIGWLSPWKFQLGCFHPFMLALPSSPSSAIFNSGRSAIILTAIQAQQTSGLPCPLSECSCQFTSAFQSAAMRSAVPGFRKVCPQLASSLSPPSPLVGCAAAAMQAETDRPQAPDLKHRILCQQSRCHLEYLGCTGRISQAGGDLLPLGRHCCPSPEMVRGACSQPHMSAPHLTSRARAGLEAAWHLIPG